MQASNREGNEDQRIVALLQDEQQRERGFMLLMQLYQERLYWHIRRMVSNHDDANDVTQNTFVKVFRSVHTFRGDSKLYTWLYRIATNEAITFLNKKNTTSAMSIDDQALNMSNRLRADVYFEGDEIQAKLQSALATLPDRQKLVFNMRYFDEMTYEEISEVLETSIGALKASYHHAVKKIELFFQKD